MKFGVQIDYKDCYSKKCKIRDKIHMTYFSILGTPQYFQNGESYKLLEVVNGDDENFRAELPSWSRGRDHSKRGRGTGVRGHCPRN